MSAVVSPCPCAWAGREPSVSASTAAIKPADKPSRRALTVELLLGYKFLCDRKRSSKSKSPRSDFQSRRRLFPFIFVAVHQRRDASYQTDVEKIGRASCRERGW